MKRPRPARDMVEAARGLFFALAMGSLLLAVLVPVATANGTILLMALAGAAVLALSWLMGYKSRSAPGWLDPVDAVAILAFALAGKEPGATLGLVLAALTFRSLYGSKRQAVLRCALYVGGLSAAVPLWPQVPGHHADMGIRTLVGAFPAMLLTAIVVQHLGQLLRLHEEAARRDLVNASAGSQLLGVTDAVEISHIAWTAIGEICAVTPGLRALKVHSDGSELGVEEASGGFAFLPKTLPTTALSVSDGPGGARRETVESTRELDAAAGDACVWVCVPLSDRSSHEGETWLLLGSPQKVPAHAITAVSTLSNQARLALRSGAKLDRLTLQARLDSLTGLANRASFNAGLAAVLEDDSSRQHTVLFVDLDDFKAVNDVFGHAAGDLLLQEVAARLCRATRPEDLCARLGGDEFAVLLRGTGASGAEVVAERVVQSIAAPTNVGTGVVNVSASVGLATATTKTGLEQLLHRADAAMYVAKDGGKGRIQVFEAGPRKIDTSRKAFERQLGAAAAKGQLVVHYQPILSLPDGRCTAVEALVRWQHPDRGLLYPESFIEAAERIGAVTGIGSFVLRQACEDLARWRQAEPGSPLALHVNISGLELENAGFLNIVTRCVQDFGLPPDTLVLEVTETTVIQSPLAIERLNQLVAHGVTIAIDDFGVGYSALTTLRSLPAQIVKIDKSLVGGCMEDPLDRAVIEAVVKMASQMEMHTIAPGVESAEQSTFLRAIGADAVQGFLYLRPTTAAEFGVWFGHHLAGFLANKVE